MDIARDHKNVARPGEARRGSFCGRWFFGRHFSATEDNFCSSFLAPPPSDSSLRHHQPLHCVSAGCLQPNGYAIATGKRGRLGEENAASIYDVHRILGFFTFPPFSVCKILTD